MRNYPKQVTLDLTEGKWGLLVAALQSSSAEHTNRLSDAVEREDRC